MDIVAWLGWAVVTILGVLWSLVWFLISGWVSTLLQIAVLIATIYFLKYGWQRAPAEILRRTRSFGASFGAGFAHESPKRVLTRTCGKSCGSEATKSSAILTSRLALTRDDCGPRLSNEALSKPWTSPATGGHSGAGRVGGQTQMPSSSEMCRSHSHRMLSNERSLRRDQSSRKRRSVSRDNLPNLDDPPATDQLTLIQAFIGTSRKGRCVRELHRCRRGNDHICRFCGTSIGRNSTPERCAGCG